MEWYSKLDGFKKGDRVRLSLEAQRIGIHRWRRHKDRIGTVVGGMTCVNVVWDGNSPKSITGYHPDYLMHADR
jgi:ribosomal protein L21E